MIPFNYDVVFHTETSLSCILKTCVIQDLNGIVITLLHFHNFLVQDDSKIYPSKQKTTSGGNVTFYCNSSNAIWYYQYFRNINSWQFIIVGSMLERKLVRYSDTGYYYCYGSYSNSSKHFIAITQLNVHGKWFKK